MSRQESLGKDGRPDGRSKHCGSIEPHPSGAPGMLGIEVLKMQTDRGFKPTISKGTYATYGHLLSCDMFITCNYDIYTQSIYIHLSLDRVSYIKYDKVKDLVICLSHDSRTSMLRQLYIFLAYSFAS